MMIEMKCSGVGVGVTSSVPISILQRRKTNKQ